jgi:hypothetical protein
MGGQLLTKKLKKEKKRRDAINWMQIFQKV